MCLRPKLNDPKAGRLKFICSLAVSGSVSSWAARRISFCEEIHREAEAFRVVHIAVQQGVKMDLAGSWDILGPPGINSGVKNGMTQRMHSPVEPNCRLSFEIINGSNYILPGWFQDQGTRPRTQATHSLKTTTPESEIAVQLPAPYSAASSAPRSPHSPWPL